MPCFSGISHCNWVYFIIYSLNLYNLKYNFHFMDVFFRYAPISITFHILKCSAAGKL